MGVRSWYFGIGLDPVWDLLGIKKSWYLDTCRIHKHWYMYLMLTKVNNGFIYFHWRMYKWCLLLLFYESLFLSVWIFQYLIWYFSWLNIVAEVCWKARSGCFVKEKEQKYFISILSSLCVYMWTESIETVHVCRESKHNCEVTTIFMERRQWAIHVSLVIYVYTQPKLSIRKHAAFAVVQIDRKSVV